MPGFRAAFGIDPEASIGRITEQKKGKVANAAELMKSGFRRLQLHRIDEVSAMIQLYPGTYGCDKVEVADGGYECTITSWSDADEGATSLETVIEITRGDRYEILGVEVNQFQHEDTGDGYRRAQYSWTVGSTEDISDNSMSSGEVIAHLKKVSRAIN